VTKAHSYVTRLASYKQIRCKIYGGCLHSMNAPASVLEDLRGDKPLALSSR
jgi:hypothetical protein